MTEEEIKKIANVIPIHKGATNILFLSSYAVRKEDAYKLAEIIAQKSGADFAGICMVKGNPSEVVKVVAAKDVQDVDSNNTPA